MLACLQVRTRHFDAVLNRILDELFVDDGRRRRQLAPIIRRDCVLVGNSHRNGIQLPADDELRRLDALCIDIWHCRSRYWRTLSARFLIRVAR